MPVVEYKVIKRLFDSLFEENPNFFCDRVESRFDEMAAVVSGRAVIYLLKVFSKGRLDGVYQSVFNDKKKEHIWNTLFSSSAKIIFNKDFKDYIVSIENNELEECLSTDKSWIQRLYLSYCKEKDAFHIFEKTRLTIALYFNRLSYKDISSETKKVIIGKDGINMRKEIAEDNYIKIPLDQYIQQARRGFEESLIAIENANNRLEEFRKILFKFDKEFENGEYYFNHITQNIIINSKISEEIKEIRISKNNDNKWSDQYIIVSALTLSLLTNGFEDEKAEHLCEFIWVENINVKRIALIGTLFVFFNHVYETIENKTILNHFNLIKKSNYLQNEIKSIFDILLRMTLVYPERYKVEKLYNYIKPFYLKNRTIQDLFEKTNYDPDIRFFFDLLERNTYALSSQKYRLAAYYISCNKMERETIRYEIQEQISHNLSNDYSWFYISYLYDLSSYLLNHSNSAIYTLTNRLQNLHCLLNFKSLKSINTDNEITGIYYGLYGMFDEAIDYLKNIDFNDCNNYLSLYFIGKVFFNNGDKKNGTKYFIKSLIINPINKELFIYLFSHYILYGISHEKSKVLHDTMKLFEKLLLFYGELEFGDIIKCLYIKDICNSGIVEESDKEEFLASIKNIPESGTLIKSFLTKLAEMKID